jgi:hypothetical protein
MFLHEGFCQKNNIFCEHCEKVFLRNDYDAHILEISKNLSNTNKESIIKRIKTDFKGFKSDKSNINKNDNNIIHRTIDSKRLNNKKIRIKIPVLEEYKIRKPIVIEPNGNITYGKNNDYLFSLFNFDLIKNTIDNNPKYNVIFNTEYNYDMSNNLINYKNINYYSHRRTKKMNNLNPKNSLYNNNIFNEKNSILISDKNKEKKNNLNINILDNNFVENHINSITIRNDFNNEHMDKKAFIRLKSNDINLKNIKNKRQKVIIVKKQNKNKSIINKQDLTYTKSGNVNQINNIFNKVKRNLNKKLSKEKCFDYNINNANTNQNNHIYLTEYNNKNSYSQRYIIQKEKKIINNNDNSYIKLPLDNISRKVYKDNINKIFEKKPENRIIKKNTYSVLNNEKNILSKNMIKCPICNIITDNLSLHNNFCKKKFVVKKKNFPLNSIKKIPKPKITRTIKLELNNKKEDIETSSNEEKNIILINNIRPTSRRIYEENFYLINPNLRRGKSQDIYIKKKKKKIRQIN